MPLPLRRLAVLASVAVAVLALVAVLVIWRVRARRAASRRGALTLAVVGPMSGKAEFQGRAMARAARLAVDEVNRRGGVRGRRVDLLVLDDGNEPARAAEQARAVATSTKALAVLGHRSSDASIAAGKVYRELGVPALTGSSTAPEVTRDNPWYFRLLFDNDYQGRFMAAYIRQVLGKQRVGLLAARAASGASLAEVIRASAPGVGLTIVRDWSFDPEAKDRGAVLDGIAAEVAACAECELLILAGSELPAVDALRHLRDAGVTIQIFAGQAVGREGFPAHFKDLPREQAHPGFYTDRLLAGALALFDTGGEEAQDFLRRYRAAYHEEPDTSAASFYDAANLALRALADTGVDGRDLAGDRTRVRDYLAAVNTADVALPGATGRIFFDAARNAVKAVAVGSFVHGTLISAPTQLLLIPDPERAPGFAELVRAGSVVSVDGQALGKVQVVYTGLDVISIPEVDLRSGTFVADLFVWFRYAGDFDFGGVEFANADEPVSLGEPIWKRATGDLTTATFRVKARFRGEFDFHRYPFDRHALRIELRHRTRTTSSLILALDRLGMATADGDLDPRAQLIANQVLGRTRTWRLADAVTFQDTLRSSSTLGEIGVRAADAGLAYSRVNAVLTIKRDVFSYGVKNLVPLLIIIIILYVGYFLPFEEIGTRSTIGITALLTVSVLYQQLSSELPSVGYLVTMDYGFYAVFALSMYATLVTVAVYVLAKRGMLRVCRWLDWTGLVMTPAVLAVLAILLAQGFGR
jgi:branched-chain amino acid transport system substrate-binding protein